MPAKAKKQISFTVPPKVAKALDKIAAEGRKVRVVGQVKGGKLEIDYAAVAELTKKFPKSNLSFVAVNAPFKSRPAY